MHDGKLRELVTLAVDLDRDIKVATKRLNEIKKQLTTEAESRQDEAIQTEGGGWSWQFTGDDGCVARVTSPAPTLKSEIDGEGKTIEKIREAAGAHFTRLFQQAPKYKLIPAFREEAQGLLGRTAGKLIKLCTVNSTPRVAFETKEGQS